MSPSKYLYYSNTKDINVILLTGEDVTNLHRARLKVMHVFVKLVSDGEKVKEK